MGKSFTDIGLLVAVVISVFRFTAEADDVMTIAEDFWEYRLMKNPWFSTYHGSYDYNDLMKSYDIKEFNASRAKAEEFMERLTALDESGLSETDRVNYNILQDTLRTFLDGNLWAMYGSLNPITFIDGIQLFGSPSIASSSSRGDFENYIARLHAVQKQVDEIKVLLRTAIQLGRTLHNVSVLRVPEEIETKIVDPPEESSYFIPFEWKLNRSYIPEEVRNTIRNRGRTAVIAYIDAFRDLKSFIIDEYMPHTRKEYGVYGWDPTNKYYAACLRWHLSFHMTPEEVHQLGLQEVERIRGKMQKIMTHLGFEGSVRDFFHSLEGDSRFYSNNTGKILKAYNDTVFKKIYPKLEHYFIDIPSVPLKLLWTAKKQHSHIVKLNNWGGKLKLTRSSVEASTYDGLGAGYSAASENHPGVFSINLFRPEEVPFFEMMALCLHETVPGHHLQHSYTMKANLPEFRRKNMLSFHNVPNWYPFYSAYKEGWALYTEYLGEEMGLFQDDYVLMGRYSYEILRAVRLVVDTGLHYYKWDRDQAIEFMANYTAFAPGSAANEIDRYITWPGQSCAYKVGEIKMKMLRATAEEQLGGFFDIREFHKVLLENGGMPLSLLEIMVNNWIIQKQNSSSLVNSSEHYSLSTIYVIIVLLLCWLSIAV